MTSLHFDCGSKNDVYWGQRCYRVVCERASDAHAKHSASDVAKLDNTSWLRRQSWDGDKCADQEKDPSV